MSPLAFLILAVLCASAPARAEGPAHASSGEVEIATRLDGSVGIGPGAGAPAAGVGGAVGLPFGPVRVEVDLGVGADLAPKARLTALLGVRVPLQDRADAPNGLGLSGAVGTGWWVDAPRPLARLGVSYDVPLRPRTAARLSLGWQFGSGGAGALLAGVGMVWRTEPKARPVPVATATPVVPAADEPPVAPASSPPLVVYPPDAMVWIPHPVCEWIPAAQLAAMLPPELVGATLQVRAPGYLPADVTLDGGASRLLTLQPAPAFGAVVVVASPGDRLFIEGKPFPIAADGTAVFGAAEGPVEVEVVGGGRRVVLDGAVARGYALWLRAPTPEPLTVSFAPNSSELAPESEATIRAYVAALGDHQVRIVGSYAVDETDAHRRLGSGRAEAVAAAVVAAGAPPDAVKVLSTARPPKDGVGDSYRYARVEPVGEAR